MKNIIKISNLLCILLVILTFTACSPSNNNVDNTQGAIMATVLSIKKIITPSFKVGIL